MHVVLLGKLRWGRCVLCHSVSWCERDACCVTRSVEVRAMHVPTLTFAFLPKICLMKVRHYASFTCLAKTCYISTNALSHSWQHNAWSTACGRMYSWSLIFSHTGSDQVVFRLGYWHSLFGSIGSGNFSAVVSALGLDHTAVPHLISSHTFRKSRFSQQSITSMKQFLVFLCCGQRHTISQANTCCSQKINWIPRILEHWFITKR